MLGNLGPIFGTTPDARNSHVEASPEEAETCRTCIECPPMRPTGPRSVEDAFRV